MRYLLKAIVILAVIGTLLWVKDNAHQAGHDTRQWVQQTGTSVTQYVKGAASPSGRG